MEYNREYARKIMSTPDNSVECYLKHLIENRRFLSSYDMQTLEKKRVSLHCQILEEFGFDPNNDLHYERSKHILGNTDRIIQYYLPATSTFDIAGRLVANFFLMIDAGEVFSSKDLNDIQRFICMFLVEKNTRSFITGTLEPYNDINIFEYVFISDLHSYYDRKQREKVMRKRMD